MDVKSAFLNSPLAETVYIEQPEGFSSGDSQVCLLQRSLYGLRQGVRDWYQTLSTFLLDEGFTRSSNDYCLSTMRGTTDAMIYALVWIDDIIFGCRCQDEVDKLRNRFSERFKMDDRGALSFERFGRAECKPEGTPADISAQLSIEEGVP